MSHTEGFQVTDEQEIVTVALPNTVTIIKENESDKAKEA